MPHQTCSVCLHPDVTEIDKALRIGAASLRELAERFALKKSALHRHRHHADAAHASKNIGEIQKIDKEIQKLLAAQTRAKRRRDASGSLAISRELRSWHTLRTKALALATASQPAEQQELTPSEALDIARAVVEAALAQGSQDVVVWLQELAERTGSKQSATDVATEPDQDE